MHPMLICLSMAVALVTGAGDASKPWSAPAHPTDAERSHVEGITTGLHKYTVTQAGTRDFSGRRAEEVILGWARVRLVGYSGGTNNKKRIGPPENSNSERFKTVLRCLSTTP